MIKNIADYLEITEKKFGSKIAYTDEAREITFTQLKADALRVASGLLDSVAIDTPVLVYMNKSVEVIEAFLGVAYTGGFYVPIDIQMPYERVKLIIDTLGAKCLITRRCDELPEEVKRECTVFYIEDFLAAETLRTEEIQARQRRSIQTRCMPSSPPAPPACPKGFSSATGPSSISRSGGAKPSNLTKTRSSPTRLPSTLTPPSRTSTPLCAAVPPCTLSPGSCSPCPRSWCGS